jgi:hypothetical protein
MKRATLLPLVFLCATTCTLAQNAASLTLARAHRTACPVGMEATHGRSLPVSMNASPAPPQGPAINGRALVPQPPRAPAINQQIHLVMTNFGSRDIVSAQFTAHGFSNKQRTIYAGAAQVPDLSSTVNVVVDVKGNGHASSDLSLSHFTAVASIDLNSITYADGSTWHSTSPGACKVIPDMVMLIAATN